MHRLLICHVCQTLAVPRRAPDVRIYFSPILQFRDLDLVRQSPILHILHIQSRPTKAILGATSIDKIREVQLSGKIGNGELKF